MPQSRTLALLFGVAAGVAAFAILIGLGLVAIAIAVDIQSDASSMLRQHPLFVSGSQLVISALLPGAPLLALWYFWQRP